MKELSNFLLEKRSDGEFDSSDVFTLDTLKMGRKMAAFQLPEPGLWVVKLIQGAVVLNSHGIQVSFQKRSVEVKFSIPQEGPGAQEILHELFRPSGNPGRALGHLIVGLRACLSGDSRGLSWEVRSPLGGQRVELDEDSTRSDEIDCSSSPDWEYTFKLTRTGQRPQLKKVLRQRVVDLVREVGDEYLAVVSRCWCSPVPITIDGVDLETAIPHPAMRHLTDCQQVGCGVDRYHMGDHWLALRPLSLNTASSSLPETHFLDYPSDLGQNLYQINTPVEPKKCFLKWPKVADANALLLVSFASLALPGVDFILDGAVVDHMEFPYLRPLRPMDQLRPVHQRQATGYRLFVCLEPDQVDLSGFSVREKSSLGLSLDGEIRPVLLDTLAHLADLIRQYQFTPAKTGKKNRFLDRLLAPLAKMNRGFTTSEAERTLHQLAHFLHDL